MKILIVSRDVFQKNDGGTLVSKRNERLLKKLGYEVNRFIIPQPSLLTRLHNFIFKESYGETKKLRNNFIQELNKDFDIIFFDSSTYGGFVKLAKNFGKKTICFYHNVELVYYEQKALVTKNLFDKLIVRYIQYNESISTILADAIITLTERDSLGLKNLYNREANLIMPTSFESRDIDSLYRENRKKELPYILFVGTNFFANVEGLEYFLANIAPKINFNVLIAGNIESAFQDKRNIHKNVKFLGQVESLDELYVNATAVIAPILSGSGLKTKTAEAFSYGKTVIGTKEAFTGIDISRSSNAGILVNNDTEFIEAINSLDKNFILNKASLELFNSQLSDDCHLCKLYNTVKSL